MSMRQFITAIFLLGLTLSSAASAQDQKICERQRDDLVNAARQACADLAPLEVCYTDGKRVAFESVEELKTTALAQEDSPNRTALVRLMIGQTPLTLALFGEAELIPLSEADTPVTLNVRNKSGYNVNLRSGPGKDYDQAGIFSWDETGLADGRSSDGSWLRLQTNDGSGWVAANLVAVDGDPNTLSKVDGDSALAFQLLTSTAETPCGEITGLLMQYPGQNPTTIQVNGADVILKSALVLLQAREQLQVYVLEGDVSIQLDGDPIQAEVGSSAQIQLGKDGRAADQAPIVVMPTASFSLLQSLPLGLVTEEALACTVGVSAEGQVINQYQQPNVEASAIAALLADQSRPVIGWTTDNTGERWWQTHDGWIRQEEVQTVGVCENLPLVDAMPATSVPMSNAANFSTDLVPPDRSMWTAQTGEDQLSGTCNQPPIAMCSHPVAITHQGNGISWYGQEPLAYPMQLTGDNTFAFYGRNFLNNAKVTMELVFTSPTAWTMTRSLVFDDDPGCTHTIYYSAVPR